jgi:DNA repair exonuclease SbcCD nuclease subunit
MRLVHLSDLHLGYRQYQRLTPTGINQREWDVANTFRHAVDRIIALRPDIVLVAGDVFHSSRPTNAAILHAFRQFLRIRTELPDTIVVIAAGDHDIPRTTESGSIMGLFEQIGIHVAVSEPRPIIIPDRDLSILAVPDGHPVPTVTAAAATRHNILVYHCNVSDVIPSYYAELDRASVSVTRRELGIERWSYVALGHYHVHQHVGGHAYYSGSLDYTSLNVWFDKGEEEDRGLKGKGFIEFDLDTGTHTFHPLPASRVFRQLPPIHAREMTVAELDAAIKAAVEKVKGGIDDKVVRLIVKDVPRSVSREIDHRAIREYKKRALSFLLDLRRPEESRHAASGAPARRPSVAEVVREQLAAREIPADLERDRLVELGLRYLGEADAFPSAPAMALEAGS